MLAFYTHSGLTTTKGRIAEMWEEMLRQFQFIPAEGRRSQCQGTEKLGYSSKKQVQECFPKLGFVSELIPIKYIGH